MLKKNKIQPWETSTTQIYLSLIVCMGDGKDLKINFELGFLFMDIIKRIRTFIPE
jgi:hypothetical protein